MEGGFKRTEVSTQRRLILSVGGMEKCGKTSWALTAPGPIAMLNTDIGHEGVVDKFLGQREIWIAHYKAPRTQDDATNCAESMESDLYTALSTARSVVVDNATEMWETLRLAHFGKLTQIKPHHYAEVNARFRRMIRDAYDSSDANLILIHKYKKQYVQTDPRKDASWNGQYERAGFSETGFLVQADIECFRENNDEFYQVVRNCRQNAHINGQRFDYPINTFPYFAISVFPDTEVDDWGGDVEIP